MPGGLAVGAREAQRIDRHYFPTAHDLRDSFVSHLIYQGYPMEDVSKIAGHSTIKITERHYYEQLQERRRSMLSDLENHITRGHSTAKKDAVEKTCPENREKKPLLSTREGAFFIVARDGIEPPTHGFSVHVPPVVKYKMSLENGAGI